MVRPRRRRHGPRRADIVGGARGAGRAPEKNKVYLNSGAATSALTGEQCSPNFVHWTYDTYMLAKSTGGAMVKAGGDTWYFLTADYAFGKQLQADTTAFVLSSGGKVMGSSAYPFPGTSDFSSFWCRRNRAAPRCWACAMPAPTR